MKKLFVNLKDVFNIFSTFVLFLGGSIPCILFYIWPLGTSLPAYWLIIFVILLICVLWGATVVCECKQKKIIELSTKNISLMPEILYFKLVDNRLLCLLKNSTLLMRDTYINIVSTENDYEDFVCVLYVYNIQGNDVASAFVVTDTISSDHLQLLKCNNKQFLNTLSIRFGISEKLFKEDYYV